MRKNANPVYRVPRAPGLPRFGFFLRFAPAAAAMLVIGSMLVAGCAKEKAAIPATAARKTVSDYFPIKVGDKMVRMQLAVRQAEMQRGLMERRDLAPNDGMIFVYSKPQAMGFWMRSTPTPLDIGFFTRDGVLAEVYPMHPFDETPVRARSTELQFALEVNQGWYRENAVKPGAQLDLKALAAALKERGFTLREFGMAEVK